MVISSSRLRSATAWLLVSLCICTDIAAQALPPARDGDIRVLFYELRNETTVWLTLEPKAPDGKPPPTGMVLTINLHFPGKQPKAPVDQVEMRAHVGLLWAPHIELWLVLDDRERIEPAAKGIGGLDTGGIDYVSANVPVAILTRIAQAKRVTGNALGLEFELTESQRRAVRAFLERVLSDNPAQFSK